MASPSNDSWILGLSFDYHNAAAALLCDGEIVAAAQEERFSRIKNDPGLPENAIKFCLEEGSITSAELTHVALYERPIVKFDRIVKTALKAWPWNHKLIEDAAAVWFAGGKFFARDRVQKFLDIAADRIQFLEHHESHAASAFYPAPFAEAAVLTLDGVGEHETGTIWQGKGGKLQKLSSSRFPNSLGLFYSAFTAYLGFEVNEGEYKVMGMAPFGEPVFKDQLLKLISVDSQGRLKLSQKFFNFNAPTELPFNQLLVKWLGPAREPESEFNPAGDGTAAKPGSDQFYANVAASVQAAAEETILEIAGAALKLTGKENLCIAGGVGLNSVANGRIQRELGCGLYVQPEAGDAGGALGAALQVHHRGKGARTKPLQTPYLGARFSDSDIRQSLEAAFIRNIRVLEGPRDLIAFTARALAEHKVIGWMQGRAEWGPRALGNRSILAHPGIQEMQAKVNEKIKFREQFRPFAPSVISEKAGEFFDISSSLPETAPESFMLSVCRVRDDKRHLLGAVTHLDGSARVHVVAAAINPLFHSLITEFGHITGIPVLLNTSFNRRGEPVVNSPGDGIKTFMWSGLDILVIGNYVIEKDEDDFFPL